MPKKELIWIGSIEEAQGIRPIVESLGVCWRFWPSDRAGKQLLGHSTVHAIVDRDALSGIGFARMIGFLSQNHASFSVCGTRPSFDDMDLAFDSGASDFFAKPLNPREFLNRLNAIVTRKKRIVCLGGGTGLYSTLTGLKHIPGTLLASVVSMSDDGGSSGRLRSDLGVLPPGDVRRSLVALSNAPDLMNRVIQYRFKKGHGLKGHNVGNLILAALDHLKGSMTEAVKALGDILNIQGIVIPVTSGRTRLCARLEDGRVIRGESMIDRRSLRNSPSNERVQTIWHQPEVVCEPDAYALIRAADWVLIGPGDLYTSVLTNLLVKGVSRAIRKSRGRKAYLCNLMTKPGETGGYTARDHVREVIRYLGSDCLDLALVSDTKIPPRAKKIYDTMDQESVRFSSAQALKGITRARCVRADIGHATELVRHDGEKLRKVVERWLKAGRR